MQFEFGFDMPATGRRIRQARTAKNMTQMQLADEMGVSFQAVSNWERGSSMPDIGKLRELCHVLDMTVDGLLGGEMQAVAKVMEHRQKQEDGADPGPLRLSGEELRAVAPLLPPREVEQVAAALDAVPAGTLIALAPFLEKDTLARLAERVPEGLTATELTGLAPFLEKDTLARLAERVPEGLTATELTGLAPFLEKDTLARLAERIPEGLTLRELVGLAPFLDGGAVRAFLEKAVKKGDVDIDAMASVAPFL